MLTEARRATVTAGDLATDMYHRRLITKDQHEVLIRSPKAARKIDMYTIVPEYIQGWSKYAREVDAYESEAEYVSDIENDYTLGDVMNGGKKALR